VLIRDRIRVPCEATCEVCPVGNNCRHPIAMNRKPAPTDPLAVDERVLEIKHLLGKTPRSLADYHRVGRLLGQLGGDAEPKAGGTGLRRRLADLVGKRRATLDKCGQFFVAYPDGRYSELEALGAGWARVAISLAINSKRDRHRLLRRAMRENWSDPDLQLRVQQLLRRNRGGGRPRRPAASHGLQPDLTRLSQLLEAADDFLRKVWIEEQSGYTAEVRKLTPNGRVVVELLARVEGQLRRLHKAISAASKSAAGLSNHARRRTRANASG